MVVLLTFSAAAAVLVVLIVLTVPWTVTRCRRRWR